MKPRAFALELIKACNLRCGYCYYAGRDDAYDPASSMSAETAERSLDVLFESGPVDEPLHVHLFGGEPLLNFSRVQHVVEYGERRATETGRVMTFEITTNGSRLGDEVTAFLNRHRVRVGISFDGPPDVQDAARPALSGSSHARIAPQIRRFLASRASSELQDLTHASVVYTRRELDLRRIVDHVEELGFRKILLTPATDSLGGMGITECDLPRLLASYDDLAADYERRIATGERVPLSWFPTLMGRLLSGRRKTHFCGGGRDYLGVDAKGDAFLCYRFYENRDFAMGSVRGGLDRSVTERLLALPLEERPACSTCWARYFCGGGCHHDNLVSGGGLGDPNPVTCEILRHSMGLTLEAYARLARAGRLPGRDPVDDDGRGSRTMSERRAGGDGITGELRLRRAPDCHVRDLDGEQVVYHPETHEVVILNQTARYIFGLCDGTRTVDAINDALGARYDADADVLRSDLMATLADLRAKGILTP